MKFRKRIPAIAIAIATARYVSMSSSLSRSLLAASLLLLLAPLPPPVRRTLLSATRESSGTAEVVAAVIAMLLDAFCVESECRSCTTTSASAGVPSAVPVSRSRVAVREPELVSPPQSLHNPENNGKWRVLSRPRIFKKPGGTAGGRGKEAGRGGGVRRCWLCSYFSALGFYVPLLARNEKKWNCLANRSLNDTTIPCMNHTHEHLVQGIYGYGGGMRVIFGHYTPGKCGSTPVYTRNESWTSKSASVTRTHVTTN